MKLEWKLTSLHLAHFLMALLIPFLLTAMLSCMKAGPQKEDLGPEVTLDQVNAALTKQAGRGSFDNLKVGQYLLFADTRRIENGDTTISLGGRLIEVLDRQDTTDQARFTLRVTNSERMLDGTFENTVSEDALWLTKVSASGMKFPTPLSPANAKSILHINGDPNPIDQGSTEPRIAFYHLKESDSTIPAPPTMAARANCSGLPNCQIPVHYIQFEIVTYPDPSNTDSYTKVAVDLAFSTLTPLLPMGVDVFDQLSGLLVEKCQSTYVPVDDRSVYVRDCETIDDFSN